MASKNAQNAAKDVLETIGKGKKVVLGRILRKNGYADNTADNPVLVTETKSFKEVIEPVYKRWEKERERLTKAIESDDISTLAYETKIKSLDVLTKNIQLLSGGKTENIGIDNDLTSEQKEGLLALLK